MTITVTQLREKQAHYLSLSSREDIIVTKNGKFYVRIVGAKRDKVESIKGLFGILPSDVDEDYLLAKKRVGSDLQ